MMQTKFGGYRKNGGFTLIEIQLAFGVLVAVLIIILAFLWEWFQEQSDCSLPIPFVQIPSAVLMVNQTEPTNNWSQSWAWSDGTNLGPQTMANPGNFNGIAFDTRVARYPSPDPPGYLLTDYILEFPVPPPGCDVSVDWNLAANIRFPTGLCARPVGGSLILLGCTDDNFAGRFWIETFSFNTTNRPGIVGGNPQEFFVLAENATRPTLFDIAPVTSPPMSDQIRFDGNFVVEEGESSNVYVGFGLWMGISDNAEISIGEDFASTSGNLLDQAVFETSSLNFWMEPE